MKLHHSALYTCIAFASSAWIAPSAVFAGGKITVDDSKSINVGVGMRTSYNSIEDGAPSGEDRSSDYALDSIRLYVSGNFHEKIAFEFNTERQSDGTDDDLRVLDAVAKVAFSEMVNVWMGRFLPPSDRSNLSGPYYLNAWNFPIAQRYPAIFAGRDDGLALWGQHNGGEFKYQVGFFEGRQGDSNQEDNHLLAARFTYNVWDKEPGYYNSSTYYGAKDILAFGFTFQNQSDGAGTQAAPADFTGWSLDALMEKKLADGAVVTVEAATYDYDTDDVFDPSITQGDGYFLLGSYLLPEKHGIGQLQPMLRIQSFETETDITTEITEVGLNYIIDGHNARASIVFGDAETEFGAGGTVSGNFINLGIQLQI